MEIPTLQTKRLLLRPFRGSDLDAYATMRSDAEILRYLVGAGTEPWDRGRSSRHMAFMIGHWEMWGTGTWAIELFDTGEFIGITGFSGPEGWPGLELAWALARPYWGKGYATEAALAALSCGFIDWQKERIISLIHPENRASIRVAEKIGERLLEHITHFGQEMLCFGIDRETYLARTALIEGIARR